MNFLDRHQNIFDHGLIVAIAILAFINININFFLDQKNIKEQSVVSTMHLNTFVSGINFTPDEKKENAGLMEKRATRKTRTATVNSSSSVYAKSKRSFPNLNARYAGIKLYPKNDYVANFINEHKEFILAEANKHKLNAAALMAMLIIENVQPDKKKLNRLATEAFNYGNLKDKGDDGNFSDAFKAFLNQCTTGTIDHKDDHYVKGKLVASQFYIFSSKWCGLKAFVWFVADRINSNHANYVGKFNGVDYKNYQEFCYAIYDAGYANKGSEVKYDVKLVRLIKQYNLNILLKQ